MPGYRVLVADTRHAKLFDLESPDAELRHLDSIENPYTGKHDRDIGADAPGHTMTRSGNGVRRTALQARSSHKQHAVTQFARLLADRVTEEVRANRIDGVVMIAAPRFMSEVKAQLPGDARHRVVRELRRDLVDAPLDDLQRRVTALVSPSGVPAKTPLHR